MEKAKKQIDEFNLGWHSGLYFNYLGLEQLPNELEKLNRLANLWCQHNRIKKLSNLPNTLIGINCSHNKLTELPNNLPNSLEYINCTYNEITSLPEKLPNLLRVMDCSHNKITKLNHKFKLPDSLQEIWCENNKIISLPKKLPTSLKMIYCNDNIIKKIHIENMKQLTNLRIFECYGNDLEDVSLSLLSDDRFKCSDKGEVIKKSLNELIKRSIKRKRFKKLILRCNICRILQVLNINMSDCLFIIAQYI